MSTSPYIAQGGFDPPPVTLQSDETAHLTSTAATCYPQLILFGDSITQYGTLTLQAYLQTQYIRRLDVINRGFSGYTAPMGLSLLHKLFPHRQRDRETENQPPLKIMTTFFGANDAALPPSPQNVALDRYTEALTRIVRYPVFQEHRTKHVIITPPPVNEYQLEPTNTRRACSAAAYALAASQLAQSLNIPCLDLWAIYMHRAGWKESMGRNCCRYSYRDPATGNLASEPGVAEIAHEPTANDDAARMHIPGCIHAPPNPVLSSLLLDGLHLTKQGYDILFWALMDVIRTDIPDCAPENLPFILVDWKIALGLQ